MGKIYSTFQIIHKLRKSSAKKKILFLAECNILVEQTMQQDFKPSEKIMTKIRGRKLYLSFELDLPLYQQLAGEESEDAPRISVKFIRPYRSGLRPQGENEGKFAFDKKPVPQNRRLEKSS